MTLPFGGGGICLGLVGFTSICGTMTSTLHRLKIEYYFVSFFFFFLSQVIIISVSQAKEGNWSSHLVDQRRGISVSTFIRFCFFIFLRLYTFYIFFARNAKRIMQRKTNPNMASLP